MCFTSAAAMRSSFCVVLNTHRRLASSGSTTLDVPTVAISGTLASAMRSRMASALGVVDGPISASMLSVWMSFFAFCTACVVSPPSSSWMYWIVVSPILRGRSSPVFFCGMPIAVVGPVAETISPILTCANALVAPSSASAAHANHLFIMLIPCSRMGASLCCGAPRGQAGAERALTRPHPCARSAVEAHGVRAVAQATRRA